jgi:hypothetical protein
VTIEAFVAFVLYRGCAVRPLSDPPELLEDPLPDDELPPPDEELPLLDWVAPEEVIVPRLPDEPRAVDDPLELPLPPSDLVVAASRVRTRV